MSERYWAGAAAGTGASAVRALTRLPLVLARGDRVEGLTPLTTDEAKLLVALDQLLEDGDALERDIRPNGNPDVARRGVPAYPVLKRVEQGVIVDFEQVLRPTPMGRVAALSLSLGTNRYVSFNPEHPVNVATRAVARRWPVVIAAGNEGADARGRETLSAWAQPRWVISVTATEHADGGPVAASSSVGDPSDPETWPTLVSSGAARTDPARFGTSFAAPRVARQLAFLSAFLDALRALAAELLGTPWLGAPLPVVHIVDRGLDLRTAAPTIELSATPLGAIDAARLQHALRRAGVAVLPPAPPRAAFLRELLLATARPVAGAPHEVGHGFVDDATTRDWLLRLRTRDALALLGIDGGDDAPAVEPGLVDALLAVWSGSLLQQGADLDAFTDPIAPRLAPVTPSADAALRLQAIRG